MSHGISWLLTVGLKEPEEEGVGRDIFWDPLVKDILNGRFRLLMSFTAPRSARSSLYRTTSAKLCMILYQGAHEGCSVLVKAGRRRAIFYLSSRARLRKFVSTCRIPMFIKLAKAGDSQGIDEELGFNKKHLLKKVVEIFVNEYSPLLVEEYIGWSRVHRIGVR